MRVRAAAADVVTGFPVVAPPVTRGRAEERSVDAAPAAPGPLCSDGVQPRALAPMVPAEEVNTDDCPDSDHAVREPSARASVTVTVPSEPVATHDWPTARSVGPWSCTELGEAVIFRPSGAVDAAGTDTVTPVSAVSITTGAAAVRTLMAVAVDVRWAVSPRYCAPNVYSVSAVRPVALHVATPFVTCASPMAVPFWVKATVPVAAAGATVAERVVAVAEVPEAASVVLVAVCGSGVAAGRGTCFHESVARSTSMNATKYFASPIGFEVSPISGSHVITSRLIPVGKVRSSRCSNVAAYGLVSVIGFP
ncbi:hypothetical protein SRABI128_02152 [Microbacterium sp. Bi128]|nr:hypothetical protein SRABI128_02152 [Microbacterium sp. Bi128]